MDDFPGGPPMVSPGATEDHGNHPIRKGHHARPRGKKSPGSAPNALHPEILWGIKGGNQKITLNVHKISWNII